MDHIASERMYSQPRRGFSTEVFHQHDVASGIIYLAIKKRTAIRRDRQSGIAAEGRLVQCDDSRRVSSCRVKKLQIWEWTSIVNEIDADVARCPEEVAHPSGT